MASLSLPSLPLSLFSLVLEFTVFSFSQDLRPNRRSLSGKFLMDVALVAKSWYHVVDELVARYHRDTMELTFKFGSRVEVLAVRQQVQLRGRAVRDLRVRMGKSDGSRFVTGVWWWMEDREIPWDALFAHMRGLKRLDLRCMPLESCHVPILLQAAAKYCLQLEMLVLPRKQDMTKTVDCAAVRMMMQVLRGAMERWHLKGRCGGLKQLTVPSREEEDRLRTSTAFINDVIEFCPNVEYLDGYYYATDEMNDVTCEEKWMISLDT
uniref:F-box domain-containing protein n=1 Tax=Phytophthora ramorum TaxID=164328 RepID=H3GMZ4_PHYRM